MEVVGFGFGDGRFAQGHDVPLKHLSEQLRLVAHLEQIHVQCIPYGVLTSLASFCGGFGDTGDTDTVIHIRDNIKARVRQGKQAGRRNG